MPKLFLLSQDSSLKKLN